MDRSYYGNMDEQKPKTLLVDYMIEEAFKKRIMEKINKLSGEISRLAEQIIVLNKKCDIKIEKKPFIKKKGDELDDYSA